MSWKGHVVSVSRKISKSIGITSQVCDYSRPFLTPLLNILCFSKSHNGFSSSGIARGGFQGFRNHRPPPPLWVMQLALFQAKKKKNSERHHVLYQRIQYHCYNEDQYEVYAGSFLFDIPINTKSTSRSYACQVSGLSQIMCDTTSSTLL